MGLYKTSLCKFFEEGSCSKGSSCNYAHGQDELRESGQAPGFKTVRCKYYDQGTCKKGDDCSYAHGDGDLTRDKLEAAPPIDETQPQPYCRRILRSRVPKRQLDGWADDSEAVKHQKTENQRPPCAFYRVGRCARGADCPYSHGGEAEMPPAPVAKVVLPPARPTSRWQPARVQEAPAAAEPPGVGPFKRTLCRFFLDGFCANGNACTFAHGEHELQQPTEGGTWVFIPSGASPTQNMDYSSVSAMPVSSLQKTQLCAYFEAGSCKKGARCTFAHGAHELVRTAGTGKVVPPPAKLEEKPDEERTQSSEGCADLHRQFRHGHFKTRMCKFYLEGHCRDGSDCRYAHDETELPAAVDADLGEEEGPSSEKHIFYKTRMCQPHLQGHCQKGSSCNYAHSEAELQPPSWAKGEPGTSTRYGIVVPSLAGTEKLSAT
ncbi:ZFP36 [Symbiodinium pilosum]|uniref:ZFP36 protein n=1 Tax=Symbiodinium pilosum TaxID=2952 RepID=A0A812XWI0_SYMPI|nr:ZFP36 [Symbiodinium pilosum]